MTDLERALEDFRAAFSIYMMKIEKRYRTFNEADCDQVSAAWTKYLKLRKQQESQFGHHTRLPHQRTGPHPGTR